MILDPIDGLPGEQRTAAALHARIAASIAAVHTAVAVYEKCPDRDAQTAIDQLCTELRRLRKAFSAFELDVDRISEQLSDAELDQLRSTIRGRGKLLDDLLFELLFPPREIRP